MHQGWGRHLALLLAIFMFASLGAGCGAPVSSQSSTDSTLSPAPQAPNPCVVSGCPGQVCDVEPRMSTCDHRPEYLCRKHSPCELQPDGRCGFTETEAYAACVASTRAKTPGPKTFTTMPGKDVITNETCTDVGWLLTHYRLERLASGSSPGPETGYPVECCAPGVLNDDNAYRCELDWPSSDVIHCDIWRQYHLALSAAHPKAARSAQVNDNLRLLRSWAESETNCSSR